MARQRTSSVPRPADLAALRSAEVEKFRRYWDWDMIVATWDRELRDWGLDPTGLFTSIEIHDPACPTGRGDVLSWWPRADIQQHSQELQAHLYSWPGTRGPLHGRQDFGGPVYETLEMLEHAQVTIEQTAAVLISASLFMRLNTRYRYPDNWPPRAGVQVFEDWAHSAMGWSERGAPWHHAATTLLPYRSDDFAYGIASASALVRYLIEEHVGLFYRFRPVRIRFANKPDAFIQKAVTKAAEEKRALQAKFAEQSRIRRAEEAAAREALRAKHPRYGEWTSLPWAELASLVWNKPLRDIAADFGVSDVAVAKRCNAQQITRPPAGFWIKVAAGTIPHPQGVPPSSRTKPIRPS